MHLGNDAITTECAYLTLGAAAVGLAAAGVAARRELPDRSRLATAGALSAAVFAAQMINVPVLPFSSGHLVGGVLLAWCLGPACGALAMAVVLLIQALLLGDGGVAALGANVINMALVPAGMVWLARRAVSNERPLWQQSLLAGALSIGSVLAASGLIVGEAALFRSGNELANLGDFATRMLGLHAWIGVGEAVVTVAALFALGRLAKPAHVPAGRWQLVGAFAAAALLVALLPFASSLPDGFESAAVDSGLQTLLLEGGSTFAWQTSLQSGMEGFLPGEQLVALVATCLASLLACGLICACQVRLAAARIVNGPRN